MCSSVRWLKNSSLGGRQVSNIRSALSICSYGKTPFLNSNSNSLSLESSLRICLNFEFPFFAKFFTSVSKLQFKNCIESKNRNALISNALCIGRYHINIFGCIESCQILENVMRDITFEIVKDDWHQILNIIFSHFTNFEFVL